MLIIQFISEIGMAELELFVLTRLLESTLLIVIERVEI